MRRRVIAVLPVLLLSACAELMNSPLSMGGLGSGGAGQPGTVYPSQVFSMGEDLYKAATLSDDEVRKMGREAVAELDGMNPVAPAGNPYARRLDKLTSDLKHAEGLDLNFKVYLVKDINAISFPDGSIRVFSALMDKMTDDELKFVIGHEIAHIKNGHRKARLQRAYASSAAIKAANTAASATASSTAGGYAAVLGGDVLANLAAEVVNGQFSQGDETECDEYGLHLLAAKNLPKEASVHALLKLGEESGASPKHDFFASLTSSHPDPAARAEHLREMIPTLAGGKDLAAPATQVARAESSGEAAPSTPPQATLPQVKEQQQVRVAVAADVPQTATASSAHQVKPTRVATRPKHEGVAGWYIQVGAFSQRDSADSLKHSLASTSEGAAVYPPLNSGDALYRVVIGPFPSRAAAQASQNSIKGGDRFVDSFVRRLPGA